MPNIEDFLPQPPWEGPPLPRGPSGTERRKLKVSKKEARLRKKVSDYIFPAIPDIGKLMTLYLDIAFERFVSDEDLDWVMRWIRSKEVPPEFGYGLSQSEMESILRGPRSEKIIAFDNFMNEIHDIDMSTVLLEPDSPEAFKEALMAEEVRNILDELSD